jgi:fumarylacetoacetate (FAA) hydrolase
MKLASIYTKDSLDGRLCLVHNNKAIFVPEIAPSLQSALDHWYRVVDPLKDKAQQLRQGLLDKDSFTFDVKQCTAPLPRAYQWADGSAYVNHVELVRRARNAEMPADFWTNPLIYQGGSDGFLGPTDPIVVADEAYGIDFEAEVAVVTDEVPMGIDKEAASQHIILFMLVNDVSLRHLIPDELAKGFGFFQSKPASSFSPFAITPDELGSYWDGERLHLPLQSHLNGQLFGCPNAGVDMTFSFPQLISHAAKTRRLAAGTIIGSGTVSNVDRSHGSSCIVEKRMLEILSDGKASTPFMRFGDRIKIEMLDEEGRSLFGAIDQEVVPYDPL